MSRALDYETARKLLYELFEEAVSLYRNGEKVEVTTGFDTATDDLFESRVQSYREVALGCALIRLLDTGVNLRLPYAKQGADAYSGRTFDQKVVNPFLHDRQIPASKGPYLATFRRSVRFEQSTRDGVLEKETFDSFLRTLDALESTTDTDLLRGMTKHILWRFVQLRDRGQVALARINRISIDQYETLIDGLLGSPSGGLFPVLLTVALLKTIRACYHAEWEVTWQGINVADFATGAPGDVSVKAGDKLVVAIEVTDRTIDRSRVVNTFNSKLSVGGISDYMFVFSNNEPDEEAKQYARVLFNQGHEVSFVDIRAWLRNNLATLGADCRALFTREFLGLLADKEVPATLKVRWNDLVGELVA